MQMAFVQRLKDKQFYLLWLLELVIVLSLMGTFIHFHVDMVEELSIISEQASASMQVLEGSDDQALIAEALKEQAMIEEHMGKVKQLAALMVLSLFFVWTVLQGFSYGLINRMRKKTCQFVTYFQRFFVYNLVLWLYFIVVVYIYLRLLVYNSMELYSVIPGVVLNGGFGLLLLVLWYVGFNGFRIIGEKKLVLLQGYTHYKQFIIFFVLSVLLIGLLPFIFYGAPTLSFVYFGMILLPGMLLLKMYQMQVL